MKTEIATLESIDYWYIFDQYENMKSIQSTWDFKCKHYPDGLIMMFKAKFYDRGNQQLEGIDFFDMYTPVVQWTMV